MSSTIVPSPIPMRTFWKVNVAVVACAFKRTDGKLVKKPGYSSDESLASYDPKNGTLVLVEALRENEVPGILEKTLGIYVDNYNGDPNAICVFSVRPDSVSPVSGKERTIWENIGATVLSRNGKLDAVPGVPEDIRRGIGGLAQFSQ